MNDIYQQNNNYPNGNDIGNHHSLFHKKTERINWKKLAAIDVDKVIQSNDVGALRDNIKHIAFCDIDSEMEVRGGDRTLAKMFKMAQLIIDYLLISQEHIVGATAENEERCAALTEETEAAKRKVAECEAYLGDVKRECHRRKRLILAQQQIMDSGPEAYHRCPYCVKAFLNGTFLQAHLERRHGERYLRCQVCSHGRDSRGDHRAGSSSPRRIEEMLRQVVGERDERGERAHSADRRQIEDMVGVIRDLERRLQEAQERSHHSPRDRREHRPRRSRSHLGDLLDDDDDDDASAQHARELAVQKAVSNRRKPKRASPPAEQQQQQVRPTTVSRQTRPALALEVPLGSIAMASEHQSPVRRVSPELLAPPPQRLAPRAPSAESLSRASLDSGDGDGDGAEDFARQWAMNEQYRVQARNEVVTMLAEHLEHHGIRRTETGIAERVLADKLAVTALEQRQLSSKFVDFAEIRRRLVLEVEAEARQQAGGGGQRQQGPPPGAGLVVTQPVRAPQAHAPQATHVSQARTPPARTASPSDSDWDDRSDAGDRDTKREAARRQQEASARSKMEYEDLMGSPRKPPGAAGQTTNNARASSELSNTMDSSQWAASDSRAATSVAEPPQHRRPADRSPHRGDPRDL